MSAEGKLHTVLLDNTIKSIVSYTKRSTVYQAINNQSGPLEDVQFANDVALSLTPKTFGSVAVARISNQYQFIKNIWLRLEIAVATPGETPFSDLLGYAIIDSLEYQVPGSPLIRFDGKLLPYRFFENCETMEKRREFARLCGYKSDKFNGKILIVPLPLPGTDMAGFDLNQSKPFPMHLLQSPMEIKIRWRQGTELITTATSFSINQAELIFRYLTLGTSAQLKKSMYRYQYLQSYDAEYDISGISTDVTLTGLRSGEMRELLLTFLPNTTGTGTLRNREFYRGMLPKNLKLIHAGQIIWTSKDNDQTMWDITTSNLPSYWESPSDQLTGNVNLEPSTYVAAAGWTEALPTDAEQAAAFGVISTNIKNLVDGKNIKNWPTTANAAEFTTFAAINNAGRFASFQKFYYTVLHKLQAVLGSDYWFPMPICPTDMTGANNTFTTATQGAQSGLTWVNSLLVNAITAVRKRNYWARIPIANLLARQQREGDYSLGADFNNSELKLTFDAFNFDANYSGKLLVQYYITTVLSYDGGLCKMVQ